MEEFNKLAEIIANVLSVDVKEITPETTFFDDLGADSLDLFQIVMDMEDEYDVKVPQEKLEKIVTVADAVEPRALEGRVVLVVGANGGLGEAASHACAQAGAKLVLLGRRVPKLNRLHAAIAKIEALQA